MDDSLKTAFIFGGLLFAACVAIGVFLRVTKVKKLTAEGKIIKRKYNFYKNKQIFKSFISDEQGFYQTLTNNVESTGVCSFSGDYAGTVTYRGRSWTARLDRLRSDDGSLMFAYALVQFDEYRGTPKNAMDFNIMLTAIEKAFLQYDPNTSITEQAINFKTKHSLF